MQCRRDLWKGRQIHIDRKWADRGKRTQYQDDQRSVMRRVNHGKRAEETEEGEMAETDSYSAAALNSQSLVGRKTRPEARLL